MPHARPAAGRRAIEVLLQAELPESPEHQLVLVDATWAGTDTDREFTLQVGGARRRVHVTEQDSPLGITDAWHQHTAETASSGGGILVVTGSVPVDQLGWDLRAHAVRRRPLAVAPTDIVKQIFGAHDLDARMLREDWLLDGLLDAEPHGGWPHIGSVLTRDRAVRALLAARVGLGTLSESDTDHVDLDADTLFDWSLRGTGPRRFAALPQRERDGLTAWLEQAAGPAAPTLLALAAAGRGTDALPLGALAAAALACPTADQASFALGALFGGALQAFDALQPYATAATGVLTRWAGQAEANAPGRDEARSRLIAALDQADQLAAQAQLSPLLTSDRLLPSGYRARLHSLADALGKRPADAVTALRAVTDHQLAALHGDSTERARTAVRLVRWLDTPPNPARSVGDAVRDHMASGGWADLATSVLAEGDDLHDSVLGESYHRLIGRVRDRRRGLDENFAQLLAAWAESAEQQAPHGALLIEDVLTEAAAPLARGGGRPLIIVLDGMSADVAVDLAGDLDRRTWTEIVPSPGSGRSATARLAAVAMLPTLTRVSRASLLSGQAAEGGQDAERSGFTRFWNRRPRNAVLFHKGGYEGAAGHRLAPELLDTLASDTVVGVVVNTIDDALADGRDSGRGRWRIRDIAKLGDLLDAARSTGRPVLLVSDHGHVLDRTPRTTTAAPADDARGARWRTGAGDISDGEVALRGPRVRGGGSIVAAWREDLRYKSRQAGYHGGASLAEVTVPVLAFLPQGHEVPAGWNLLPAEQVPPDWWREIEMPPDSAAAEELAPAKRAKGRKPSPEPSTPGLFAAAGHGTLGEQTIQSKPYLELREFVRNAPDHAAVRAAIDALVKAGGRLSPAAVANAAQAETGKSERNPARFVTMLERLLNIDGYPVLQLVESGRTVHLDKELLRQQFTAGGGV